MVVDHEVELVATELNVGAIENDVLNQLAIGFVHLQRKALIDDCGPLRVHDEPALNQIPGALTNPHAAGDHPVGLPQLRVFRFDPDSVGHRLPIELDCDPPFVLREQLVGGNQCHWVFRAFNRQGRIVASVTEDRSRDEASHNNKCSSGSKERPPISFGTSTVELGIEAGVRTDISDH
jgi:hypothetical protein